MKGWVALVCATLVGLTLSSLALASEEEDRLIAVFFGRVSSYVELPKRAGQNFIITVIGENSFGNLLDELYKDKTIGGKPVRIRYVAKVEEIGQSDILFVNLLNHRARQSAIDYAQKNSILSISHSNGFAERGGIIQFDFVRQQTHLKINDDAAIKSNIKIGAHLLSLANVIRGESQ